MNWTTPHRCITARRTLRIMAVLVFSGVCVGRVEAQSGRAPFGVWVTGGVGGGGSATTDGMAVSAAITVQRAPHQLTARASGFIVNAESGGEEIPGESSLLYGRAHRSRWHNAAISAGLGVVARSRCDSTGYSCEYIMRPGLPLAAEVTLRFLPVLGLGLQVFGNVNSMASNAGILITVQVGWLR